MIRVGVIDDDAGLVDAMTRFWCGSFSIQRLDSNDDRIPEHVDVLIADLASLGGHARRFLSDVRFQRPSLPILLTYLYFDATQEVERDIRGFVDLSIIKPYDLARVEQTVRHLYWKSRKTGSRPGEDRPSG